MVVTNIIASSGWRTAYVFTGILIMVVLIPVILFVVKMKPSEMGLEPLGKLAARGEVSGLTQKESMQQPAFWILFIGTIIAALFVNTNSIYLVNYLTTVFSYTPQNAALILSVAMVALAAAKILSGRFYDKLGVIPTVLIIGVCSVAGCACLLNAQSIFIGALGAVFMAIAGTHVTVSLSYLAGKFFGQKYYGAIYSTLSMSAGIGAALAPIVGGIISNKNAPNQFYFILMGFSVVICAMLLISNSMRPKATEVKTEVQA